MLFSVFYFFLLEFFSIFQNFQYFSVFLGIFQYFSVFFSIFGTFQYFSCFSVFSVFFSNFQYSADKEDILSLSTTRDDAAQDVFKKKKKIIAQSNYYMSIPQPFSYFSNFRNKKYQMSVSCQLYRLSLLHELPTG